MHFMVYTSIISVYLAVFFSFSINDDCDDDNVDDEKHAQMLSPVSG